MTHSRNVSQTETVTVLTSTNNVQGVQKVQQCSFNSIESYTTKKRRQVMNVKDLLQHMNIKATSKKSETSGAGGPVLPPPPLPDTKKPSMIGLNTKKEIVQTKCLRKSEGSRVKKSESTKLNNRNNLISNYFGDIQMRKKVLHTDKRTTE